MIPLVTRLLAALAGAGSLASGPALDEGDRAPDGARGLGATGEAADVIGLLRSSRDEDQAFLAELDALPSRVEGALAELRAVYERLGYFAWPADDAAGLDDLHAAFERGLADPYAALREDEPRSTAFAAMLVDVRFRVRLEIVRAWRTSERDLVGGLELLRSKAHGWGELAAPTVLAVARRVDVAASRLRALLKDLTALHRRPTRGGEPSAQALDLIAWASRRPGSDRRVDEALAAVDRRRDTMLDALFTHRLEARLAAELRWRARAFERAERLVGEARVQHPDLGPPDEGPNGLSRTERLRRALSLALEGLEFDPLHEELTWIAAESSDFVGGSANTRSLYERFLALRGIRSWDDRTYRDRELTPREKRALWFAQNTSRGLFGR